MAVELLATSPPQLEARFEEIDEAFGVTKLGRRHPVELAVTERLGRAVCVGRGDTSRRYLAEAAAGN